LAPLTLKGVIGWSVRENSQGKLADIHSLPGHGVSPTGVAVLTLTADAVAVIRDLTSQPETPPDTGLRIAVSPVNGSVRSLQLSITDGPHPDDEVLESEGVRVYLEPTAASFLKDKTLDAEIFQEDRPSFRIIPQT
jgi:Fe-S cluster assembly iron-binding protein IscA